MTTALASRPAVLDRTDTRDRPVAHDPAAAPVVAARDRPPEPAAPPGSGADAPAWATLGRCRGLPTEVFFSDDPFSIARAKAICDRCPVRDRCLAAALERGEPWGVWGGELFEAGRIVATKRPRGRPPKQPRPDLVVDEVPLPPGYGSRSA
jgi:WhiB family redox-sensing transcriptional regulator